MPTTHPSDIPPSATPASLEIAVVVLAVGAPKVLVEAVRSLLAQDMVPEIVVVNSGGGDARGLLMRHGLDVTVLQFEQVLFAGAARNAGIAASRAPIVGFLACDCIAEPGWVANRLARHRAGHAAVASSVTNSHPHNLFAWAAHVCTYALRLPQLQEKHAIRFGVSYERELFQRHGPFLEHLRTGEDDEFHRRLAPAQTPVWAPEVRTMHRNPTSMLAFVVDQFRRGRHVGLANEDLSGLTPGRLVRRRCRSIRRAHRVARRALTGDDRTRVMAAWPLVMVGMLAHAAGIIAFYARRA